MDQSTRQTLNQILPQEIARDKKGGAIKMETILKRKTLKEVKMTPSKKIIENIKMALSKLTIPFKLKQRRLVKEWIKELQSRDDNSRQGILSCKIKGISSNKIQITIIRYSSKLLDKRQINSNLQVIMPSRVQTNSKMTILTRIQQTTSNL
eukprot:403342948